MQTTLTELNRKLATQEKKERESQKKKKDDFKNLKNLVILGFIITNITLFILLTKFFFI
jgi:hypothetical protein